MWTLSPTSACILISIITIGMSNYVKEFWWLDHPFYINQEGLSYCSSSSHCCSQDRNDDNCSVSLPEHATACYCDSFCFRSSYDMDCCPDYFYTCGIISNFTIGAEMSTEKVTGEFFKDTVDLDQHCIDSNGKRVELGAFVYQFCNRFQCLYDDEMEPLQSIPEYDFANDLYKPTLHQIDHEICANDDVNGKEISKAVSNQGLKWSWKIYEAFAPLDISTALQMYTTGLRSVSDAIELIPLVDKIDYIGTHDIDTLPDYTSKINTGRPVFDQGRCAIASTISSVLNTILDGMIISGYNISETLSVQHILSCVISQTTCTNARISAATVWLLMADSNGYLNIPLVERCYPYRNGDTDQNCVENFYEVDYDNPRLTIDDILTCNRKVPIIESKLRAGRIERGDVQTIKRFIIKCGSVQATVKVHPSFFSYGNGVYSKLTNSSNEESNFAYHSIRLIGWSSSDNNSSNLMLRNLSDPTDDFHWLAVNSWGKDWGSDGMIRIPHGSIEIENYVIAVMC